MTALLFHAANSCAEIRLGRSAKIKIVGGAISAGGPVLAFHTAGAWHVGNQRIDRIVCRGRVRIEFESQGRRRSIGPFDEFHLAGEEAVSNQGVLARYKPVEQTWFFERYDSESDGLVVLPVSDLAAV